MKYQYVHDKLVFFGEQTDISVHAAKDCRYQTLAIYQTVPTN
jgi:hypothetical protein